MIGAGSLHGGALFGEHVRVLPALLAVLLLALGLLSHRRRVRHGGERGRGGGGGGGGGSGRTVARAGPIRLHLNLV
jgi:hypothetical protein